MEPQNCIVVGGGPAGLLAAIHLAGAGLEVTVLESRAELGGRASSEPRAGLLLNQGPHALYLGGAARRELAAVGIDPPGWRPTVATLSILLRDGGLHRSPGGPRALASFARWAAGLRSPRPDLARVSVDDWLAAELEGEDARRLASTLVRVATYTADQATLSAGAAAGQTAMAAWPGVRYLGGWQTLVERLATAARARGASIECHSTVRAVRAEDPGWTVSTDAGDRTADLVLLASGGPERAARLLGREIPATRTARRGRRAGSAAAPAAPPAAHLRGGARLPPLPLDPLPAWLAPVHLSLAAYLTPDDRTSGTRETLEAIADTVQPGWRAELVAEPRHLARMTVHTAIASAAAGGLAGRPGPELAGAPGLALAGDWVGAEGMLLDASLASARAAARALLATRTQAAVLA
jgi:phytoene dehydrogenase-like protein